MENRYKSHGPNRTNRFSPRKSYGRNTRKSSGISTNQYIAKAVETESSSIYVTDALFNDFKLDSMLQKNILSKRYTIPTKIQNKAIPAILAGKDILGIASTGSGKTAAFLLPMINKFLNDGTQTCLIVVPTRELGSQIQDEFRELARGTNLKSVLIIGGKSIRDQMYILNKRPHFIIATPGRLKDIYERKGVNLAEVNNVILDEVDRMLDMGFINDIRFIIDKLDTNRQSLFFSATMSPKAEQIANSLLKNPTKIEIESQAPQHNVDQDIVKIDGLKKKEEVLLDLLSKEEFKKVLIFTRTKRNADRLSNYLYDNKLDVDALHGDKRQSQRSRIIDGFKKGNFNILIATDVASRGLDVSDITHVINYDEPECYEDYIHRIGRTGRAGKKGYALTFIDR